MKKLSNLIILITLMVCPVLKAQDMIVKSDGSIVKAKIIEITDESVKYKKADNPDGPLYTLSKESITSINYANGEVEKFETAKKDSKKNEDNEDEEDGEEKPKGNPILKDEQLKRTIEGIAKDVGEQLIRNCANGKVDNSTTEIYWDQVFKDAITNEINIAIITSWKPKWTDGSGKWVKGKIIVAQSGEKRWVYQNDNGLTFSSCAKGFKIK